MRADLNIFFISLYYRVLSVSLSLWWGREGKEGKSLCGGNELRRFPFFSGRRKGIGTNVCEGNNTAAYGVLSS